MPPPVNRFPPLLRSLPAHRVQPAPWTPRHSYGPTARPRITGRWSRGCVTQSPSWIRQRRWRRSCFSSYSPRYAPNRPRYFSACRQFRQPSPRCSQLGPRIPRPTAHAGPVVRPPDAVPFRVAAVDARRPVAVPPRVASPAAPRPPALDRPPANWRDRYNDEIVAASGALGDIPQYLLRRHGLSIDQILQFRVHFANGIGGDRPTRGVQ